MSGRRFRSIVSLLHECVHDEADDGVLRDRVVDGLWVWIPVAVTRPEDDRLDDEPGRNGRIGKRTKELPAHAVVDVLREESDEPAAATLEPERGQLGVIARGA